MKLDSSLNNLDVWIMESTDGNNKVVTVFNTIKDRKYREILGDEHPLYDVVVSLKILRKLSLANHIYRNDNKINLICSQCCHQNKSSLFTYQSNKKILK